MVGQYIRVSPLINESFVTRYINLSTSVSVDESCKGGIKKCGRYAKLFWRTFWQGLFLRPSLVISTMNFNP
jgi:hypothetical protein